MTKTCDDCKYVGDGSEFYFGNLIGTLCKNCYHKKNGSPHCRVCHEYCHKDDINFGHIICESCWYTYEQVKQLIEVDESDESSDEQPYIIA